MPIALRTTARLFAFPVVIAVLVMAAWPRAQAPASAPARAAIEPATLVLQNGTIVTAEDAQPEVQALAIRGDVIVALGTAAQVSPYIGPKTQVIDLKGATAVPGLIDSHGHFNGIGQAKLGLELMPTTSWDQIVGMVGDAVKKAKPGEWIVGRG